MNATQRTTVDALLERAQSLIDALLIRFRNIIELAPLPESEITKEAAAAQAFQTKVETAALIRAGEDLLKLTRELKEMWLFGPLRELGEGEAEVNAKMDEDANAVGEILGSLLGMGNGKS